MSEAIPPTHETGKTEPGPVQHCPFCGELIGSFWARRDTDGAHWCESCQRFFTVTVVDD